MVIKASARQIEEAREEDEELTFVGVTYVGDRAHYLDNAVRTQGHWPSYGGFTAGNTQIALLPDRGLGYFERHADFEVDYTAEGIAQALLDKNYLAPEVFQHGGGGGETRQRLLDFLEIDRLETTQDGIRGQLGDIAGVDDPGQEAAHTLADKLVDPDEGYTRTELKDVVGDLREDADEISLNAGKVEFGEYLEEQVQEEAITETALFEKLNSAGGDE